MITYLLQLTLCWIVFYAAYHLFLREETHFNYNRWYLLTAVCLGMAIPLVDWSNLMVLQTESLGNLYIAPFNAQMAEWDLTVQATSPQTVSWFDMALVVYGIGCLMAAIQLIRGWLKILMVRRKSEIHRCNGYSLALTNQHHMPFSFLGTVYYSKDFYRESSDNDQILAHELFHISARHSLDIIFLEILKVVFWFHPLVYIYKNEIQQIHEYQADYVAYNLTTKRQYGQLLLSHAESGRPIALTNPFFNSQLKNRFKMMTKKPSARRTILKYLVILPLMGMSILLFSYSSDGNFLTSSNIVQQDTLILPPPPPLYPNVAQGGEEVFRVVEQMPHFPGCADVMGDYTQEKACADKKMLEFIYSNIKYPDLARKNGVEGNVVVVFIIEKDGSITNPMVVRDPGFGLGDEAIRIVDMMNGLSEKWSPGVQRGQKVRVQFVLPMKFQLNKKENKDVVNSDLIIPPSTEIPNVSQGDRPPPPPTPAVMKGQEEVFRVVEQMPRFHGCEAEVGGNKEKKSCADRKMLNFLYNNVKYPSLARDNGIEGAAVVSFTIEKDGSITEPKIIRDPGAGLGEEAIRVVNMMRDLPEKWTPGVQRGHNVRVQFILPVNFELRTNDENQDQETRALLVIDEEIIGTVDRVELDKAINPNDIESISVIKGESATEKYGVKGTNGVIEITTKWRKEKTRIQLNIADVKIYPVPAESQLNIEGSVQTNGLYLLEVRDLKGVVLRERKVNISGGTIKTHIDINGITPGPYYLLVSHEGKVFSKAFVKQ